MTIAGLDYAFSPHPVPGHIRSAGALFVCRYLSPIGANDTNGKNLLPGELAALRAASLSVVVVEEGAAQAMLSGRTAGTADAVHAAAVTSALGMDGVPVYFACDFDATEAQQVSINEYLQGASSVIGLARTGIYGGYYPVKRALDAGLAKYAWQTFAWSGGQWDARAQIRQGELFTLDGASCDHDTAMTADYGQWPRPAAPPAPPNTGTANVTLQILTQGMTGAQVRSVQALAGPRRGHQAVIDSEFGPDTLALVKNVQAVNGLPQTGTVDEATWKALLNS